MTADAGIRERVRTGDPGLLVLGSALALGGAVGLVFVLLEIASGELSLVLVLASVAFGASIWTGWAVWRGHERAAGLATALFALQIPDLSIAGVTYQFFTLAAFRYRLGTGGQQAGSADVGAGVIFALESPGIEFVGINFLALGAVLYLVWRRLPPS